MAAPLPTERLRLTPRSAVLAVALLGAALAAIRLLMASQRVIGWILAAAALAGLLYPLVALVSRRLPRGVAVVLVAVGTLGVGGVVAYGAVDGLVDELDNLQRTAPRRMAELERSERFGDFVRDYDLVERVDRLVEEVPERLRGGTPADAIRSAATRGVAFLATGVLTLFFLLHGPRLAAAAARQIHDQERRERLHQVAANAYRRGFGYARASLVMAAAAGLFAFAVGRAADVPGVAPLAVWVALWDLVPLLGAVVGALPIVVLAGIGSPTQAVVLAGAFIIYELVETLVVHPRIERRTVRVGPFLTVAGGFLGLELYGIGGALLVLLALAVGVAVADELAPEAETAQR